MAELTRGQKRREYQKMYREAHKGEKQLWSMLYWMDNKEKIDEKRLKKFNCDICGGKYTHKHIRTHEKSKKHQEALSNTSDTSANV